MSDHKISSLINLSTWGGAFITGVGALTLTQWLAVGGFVLAAGGFCVNTWHKIAMYRLAKRESDLRFKNLT